MLYIYDLRDNLLAMVRDYKDLKIDYEVNTWPTLSFSLAHNSPAWPYLVNENRVKFEEEWFVIKQGSITRSADKVGMINLECPSIAVDLNSKYNQVIGELDDEGVLQPLTVTAGEFLDVVLGYSATPTTWSGWSSGHTDNISKMRSFNQEWNTVTANLRSMIDKFEGYLVFNSSDRTVDFRDEAHYGSDNGVYINYAKNMVGISRDSDSNEFVTRLYCYGNDNGVDGDYEPFYGKGNINLNDRPKVTYEGNVYTFFPYIVNFPEEELKFVVLPGVREGLDELMTRDSAIAWYNDTDNYLGRFATSEEAWAYVATLHENMPATDALQVPGQISIHEATPLGASSPLGQPYFDNFTYFLELGYTLEEIQDDVADNGESSKFVKVGHFSDSDYIDPQTLYDDAHRKYLKEMMRPKVTYKVSLMDLSKLSGFESDAFSLGDWIHVKDSVLGIDVKARIVKITYCPGFPDKTSIEISNVIEKVGDVVSSALVMTQNLEGSAGVNNLIKGYISTIATVINGTATKMYWDANGIVCINTNDPDHVVRLTAGGLGVSDDGGQTYSTAITGYGVLANTIVATSKILVGGVPTILHVQDARGLTYGPGATPLGDVFRVAEDFDNSNNRIRTVPATPVILTDGTAIDAATNATDPDTVTPNTNGSVDISFEWEFTQTDDDVSVNAYKVDGFIVWMYCSNSSEPHSILGTGLGGESSYIVPATHRAIVFPNQVADKYYTFGVQAYRRVDYDITASGIIVGPIVQPELPAESPFRPMSNVIFRGDIAGTIDGNAVATVITTLNGALQINDYNQSNNRISTKPANPTMGYVPPAKSVDHTLNNDGSANISFEWHFNKPSNAGLDPDEIAEQDNAYNIDGFIVYKRSDPVLYGDWTFGVNSLDITATLVPAGNRGIIFRGTPSEHYYVFGVVAYRRVDWDVAGAINGIIISDLVWSESVPYQPSTTTAFKGDIKDSVYGGAATPLAGIIDLIYGAVTLEDFSKLNNQNGTTPTAPEVDPDGYAITSTLNKGGSADISFQWSFTNNTSATPSANDVDGFIVYMCSSITDSLTGDITPAASNTAAFALPATQRALVLKGQPSDHYYSFGVRSYRLVSKGVGGTNDGVLVSSIIKPSYTGSGALHLGREYPSYRPASSVSFEGNLVGTIGGVATGTIINTINGALQKTDFDKSNNRIAVKPANPTVSSSNPIEHVDNTNGSIDLSFKWEYDRPSSAGLTADEIKALDDSYKIDGFIVYRAGTAATPTSLNIDPTSPSVTSFLAPANNRGIILKGAPVDHYYLFGIVAYRRVDYDVLGAVEGLLTSDLIKPSGLPYHPGDRPDFKGDIKDSVYGGSATPLSGIINLIYGAAQLTDFDNLNNQNSIIPATPVLDGYGDAIDSTLNKNGSADISFQWEFTNNTSATPSANDVDGFIVYVASSLTDSLTGDIVPSSSNTSAFVVPAAQRYLILKGMPPEHYYSFGIRSYRMVSKGVGNTNDGILVSAIIKPTYTGSGNPVVGREYPSYRPASSVSFDGDITGTIERISTVTIVSTLNGALQKTDFDKSNNRITVKPADPTVSSSNPIEHVDNTNGSIDLSFKWEYTKPSTSGLSESAAKAINDAYNIDGFIVYRSGGDTTPVSTTISPSNPSVTAILAPANNRGIILKGSPVDHYYLFGIVAYRRVDYDIEGSFEGLLVSNLVQPSGLPYHPGDRPDFKGNIKDSVYGDGATPLADIIDLIYGAAQLTDFDNLNNQNGIAPVAPVLDSTGRAIDHTVNKNGSVDISFEWAFTNNTSATPAGNDIDGFIVYIKATADYSALVDIVPSDPETSAYVLPASQRGMVFKGMPPTQYYAFGLRSYRMVSKGVGGTDSGVLLSAIVKPTYEGSGNPVVDREKPSYRPASSIAFEGNITDSFVFAVGTTPTTMYTIATQAIAAWGKFSGNGGKLPAGTVDFSFIDSNGVYQTIDAADISNSIINYNLRNDTISVVPAAPVIPSDRDDVLSFTLNTGGDANIRLLWNYDGVTDDYNIDGFRVRVMAEPKPDNIGYYILGPAGDGKYTLVSAIQAGLGRLLTLAEATYAYNTYGTKLGRYDTEPLAEEAARLYENSLVEPHDFFPSIKSGSLSVDGITNEALWILIQRLGLNTISVPVIIEIPSETSSSVYVNTASLARAKATVAFLATKNIRVLLEPYPYIDNGRVAETVFDPTDYNTWFYNWKTIALRTLIDEIANVYPNVYAMYIASNLICLEGFTSYWLGMVDYVRATFSGKIIYRTNWWMNASWVPDLETAYRSKLNSPIWEYVDIIGIASYFELTDEPTPSVATLKNCLLSTAKYGRGQNVYQEIKNFADLWDKPILLGELGFPSHAYCAGAPWDPNPPSGVTYVEDQVAQANAFEAYNQVFCSQSWFMGYSIFVLTETAASSNYSVLGKLAESIIFKTVPVYSSKLEATHYISADKRLFIDYGVPSDLYYSFSVQAYRMVDNNISTNGVLLSEGVSPIKGALYPYPFRPSSNPDFKGKLNGTNTSTITEAALNFNLGNDRDITPIDAPTFKWESVQDRVIDYTLNSDSSCNLSIEWLWGRTDTPEHIREDNASIDGFILFMRTSPGYESYDFGTAPNQEKVYYLTPEKRAMLLYSYTAATVYHFGVCAYRIVAPDLEPTRVIRSSIASPSQGWTRGTATSTPVQSPEFYSQGYLPTANTVFSGSIARSVGAAIAASIVADKAANSVQLGQKYSQVEITDEGIVCRKGIYTDDATPVFIDSVRVNMNSNEGFKIVTKNPDESWTSKFWADTDGVVHLVGLYAGTISADHITAGRMSAGKINFDPGSEDGSELYIDGSAQNLVVKGGRGSGGSEGVVRVKLGHLGNDYGIEVRSGSGALIFSANGLGTNVVTTNSITPLAVTNDKINDIHASKITAGKIDAAYIDVDTLNVNKIVHGTNTTNYGSIGGSFCDFIMYSASTEFFRIYDALDSVGVSTGVGMSIPHLSFIKSGPTHAYGNWTFLGDGQAIFNGPVSINGGVSFTGSVSGLPSSTATFG